MSKTRNTAKQINKAPGKESILDTAYSLFLKKGYNSVSIKDIMADTKLSKGGIYHHFDSKESILFAVLDQYFFKVLHMDVSLLEGMSFREKIRQIYLRAVSIFGMVEAMGDNGIKYPIRRLFHFQLECEDFPEVRTQFKLTSMAYRETIRTIVADGIQEGEVFSTLDAETISYQIVGMIEGIAIHHSTIKNNVEMMLGDQYKKVFDSYLDFICPNLKNT